MHEAFSKVQVRRRWTLDVLREGDVITAAALARRVSVSERTIYRYVRDLRTFGFNIEGDAGVGYVLRNRRD